MKSFSHIRSKAHVLGALQKQTRSQQKWRSRGSKTKWLKMREPVAREKNHRSQINQRNYLDLQNRDKPGNIGEIFLCVLFFVRSAGNCTAKVLHSFSVSRLILSISPHGTWYLTFRGYLTCMANHLTCIAYHLKCMAYHLACMANRM